MNKNDALTRAQIARPASALDSCTRLVPETTRCAAMTLTAGAHLGPYEIQSAIGSGGMGEVEAPMLLQFGALVTRL